MRQTLIRSAVAADVSAVCRLQQQWFAEDSTHGFVPDSPERVAAALGAYFLVAEVAGEIIGFISGASNVSEGLAVIPAGASYLELDSLYVQPEFRRQGIGGALVTQQLAEARQRGVAYASLYSAARDLQGVLSFYERHDFQSWYVRMFQKL